MFCQIIVWVLYSVFSAVLLDTFWTNPQYRVTVTDPDDDDDDDLCTVIIGLMQKDRRKKREEGLDMLTIGYCIYQVSRSQSATVYTR